MILRVQSEDGQDFILKVGEGGGSIAIATSNCQKAQPDLENFTIEEARAIVGLLNTAIPLAEVERDEMEARNGH